MTSIEYWYRMRRVWEELTPQDEEGRKYIEAAIAALEMASGLEQLVKSGQLHSILHSSHTALWAVVTKSAGDIEEFCYGPTLPAAVVAAVQKMEELKQ